jgi:hypothetical protein
MASTFDKTRIEKERHGVVAMRGDLRTALDAAGSAPRKVLHDRRLKIAIDMRPLIIGFTGGMVQNLIGVFRELFSHYTEHLFLSIARHSIEACSAARIFLRKTF